MTIVRAAEVDMIGFGVGSNPATAGQIAIRWAKITYDDSAPSIILVRENHRTVLNPGDDIDVVMTAIDGSLSEQGYGTMPATDITLVKAQAQMIWTPGVVSGYEAWVAEQAAAAEAQAQVMAAAQAEADAKAAADQEAVINAAVAAALAKQSATQAAAS